MPRSLIFALSLTASAAYAAAEFPAWAYAVAAPGAKDPVDNGLPRHVPNSTVTLTLSQYKAHMAPVPDWHPDEHPPMPKIASVGREPQVWACSYCHLPNGAGRPENASLAGLTPNYIKQQLLDFKQGNRTGSEPRRGPQKSMIAIAKALSEEDAESAAAYFSSLKPQSFIRVVEADTVPKSYVAGAMLARIPGGGEEPLVGRIIEMPDDLAQADNRDSQAPYTAFVPVGSIKRGEAIVMRGGSGKTLQCTMCHGPELKGLGDFPRLAGRSPSYLMRELYDFKSGTRIGATGLMKVEVANLTQDDMVDISAYLASRSL
ncbi:MAG TPA: c-type cytochrome [Opitutaceae bacterium]|nr:c-type cytochrome [Opitutaceae bacterium]